MSVERWGPAEDGKQLRDFECGRDLCFRKTTLAIA